MTGAIQQVCGMSPYKRKLLPLNTVVTICYVIIASDILCGPIRNDACGQMNFAT
ncbi:hypothetical protein RhiirA1_421934 [Rhizophagus irregularis]|uniref:Uncharacterized protein n=1 Tax=Rhizophagus irregularis TaxID=588596 RepID=A0A2N0RLB1_9GLOM|nr:hypothetical protein RhiirA1_421934 [Rhizophagus irregularis]GET55893.1 hypothetical protein RIR_e6801_A0A2N0RLB1_9GLOM [Rhizophagus irregularis DAOM 181602=DAOM 197198]